MSDPAEETIVIVTAAPALSFSAAAAPASGRVRRPARLFVAGEYPDKSLTVTPDDLHVLVAKFHAEGRPLPVKAEHHDGPLDPLGEVVALHVEGKELYGMLAFSAGMDAHLRERGVEYVSVCLVRDADDTLRLKETSLVYAPRVPGAGFLPTDPAVTAPGEAVEAKMAAFRRAGKLTPAMEPHARRLLGGGGSSASDATFAAAATEVATETEALLRALPVVQPRDGAAAAVSFTTTAATPPATASAEVTRLARSFGLDPRRVAGNLPSA